MLASRFPSVRISFGLVVAFSWSVVGARILAAQALPACVSGCGGTYSVAVTPDGQATEAKGGSTVSVSFDVLNRGTSSDTYTLTCATVGSETCVSVSPTSMTLGPDLDRSVTVTFTAGAVGTAGSVKLTATGHASDVGAYSVTNVPGAAPTVDMTPYNYETQDMGRCSASCFAVIYAQSTVPYFSLDAPRSVTLLYHGDRVDPKPFIHVNVQHPWGDLPTVFWLQARKSDGSYITFLNGETKLRFAPSTLNLRLAGQFDAASNGVGPTAVYGLDIIVTAEYPTGTRTVVNSRKLVVVNENGSAIARGWTLAGVQRLYAQGDGSALITQGEGSAVYFQKVGTVFTTPTGEFSKLVTGTPSGGVGWTRLFPDSTKIVFDNTGRMTELRDRFNNISSVTYDGSGRPWQLKDPLNIAISLAYGANGLNTINDVAGRVTTVTVDASKRLTAIRDPDNVSTTFGYDGTLRLTAVTNRNGATTSFGYDPQSGKLATVTSPRVPVLGEGGSIQLVTSYAAWQRRGVPYTVTAGTPFAAPRADTVYGRVINAAGDTTRFTVDRWGQPVQTTNPLGRTVTVSYSSAGLPLWITSPTGAVDYFSYNADGLVTWSSPAGGTATSIRYAAWALPDSIWGQTAVRNFVSSGKIDSVRVASAYVTRYEYDSRGRLIRATDPLGHLLTKRTYHTSVSYENLWKDSVPGGRVASIGYDASGRPYSTSRVGAPTQTVSYDVMNRIKESYDGVNPSPTRYAYDSLYLRSVTDLKGQIYRFAFDSLGRVTARTDPLGKLDRYAYDRLGNVRRWWNRRGDSTDYVYDRVGRLVKKFGPKTSTDSVCYSADDRLVKSLSYAVTPTWEQTSYLDVAGRVDSVLTAINGYNYTRRYRYSSAGLLDSVWSSTPPATALLNRRYMYNASRATIDSMRFGPAWTGLGMNGDILPNQIALPGPDTITRDYSSTHQGATINSLAMHNDIGYDTLQRIVIDNTNFWGTGISGRRYGYDGIGRVVVDSFTRPSGSPCSWNPDFGYQCPPWIVDSVRTFAYDLVGNRTDHGAAYSPLGSNRLSVFDSCAYTTDDDGNVTSRTCGGQVTTYWWSSENRLDSARVGGVTYRVAHDAAGRLMRMGDVYFLWDGDNLLAELDNTGKVKTEYSYYAGLDNPHATVVTSGQSSWMRLAHTDGLGSLRAETDTSATVTASWHYSAWGARATPPGGWGSVTNRTGWKGALFMPELGEVYYMRNRWYEPRTGRFLSEDPSGLAGGINPYVFAGNDPVNGRDPSGLSHCGSPFTEHDPDGTCPSYTLPPVVVNAYREWFWSMVMADCAGEDPQTCIGRVVSNWEYDHGRDFEEEPAQSLGQQGPVCIGPGTGGGRVQALGLGASAVTPNGGVTHEDGSFSDGTTAGLYETDGFAIGYGGGVGVVWSTSTNRISFQGRSRGGCLGASIVSFCGVFNSAGATLSVSIGPGTKWTAYYVDETTQVVEVHACKPAR